MLTHKQSKVDSKNPRAPYYERMGDLAEFITQARVVASVEVYTF